jgi:hypothetical protein
MSQLPATPSTLPEPPRPPGLVPEKLVSRWDRFLGELAVGLGLPEAMQKCYVTRGDIETMTRLSGEAGAVERKRWDAARLAGRKWHYTRMDLEDVFERIAGGKKVKDALCDVKGPGEHYIYFMKMVNKDPELQEAYRDAKEIRAQMLMEENIDIVDDTSRDVLTKVMIDKRGEAHSSETPNMAAVTRDRLRADERFRQARSLAATLYGDKTEQTVNLNINYAERLEQARARERTRNAPHLTREERGQAVDAEFIPVQPDIKPDTDTGWMDEKPKDLDTTWLEEK